MKKLLVLLVLIWSFAFVKAQDVKISELPSATSIGGDDVAPIVQNNITKKIPYSIIVSDMQNEVKATTLAYMYPILHFNSNYELGTAGIQNSAVTSDKILDGTIGYWDLQDLTITPEKLRSGSVTSDKIVDETILPQDLSQAVIDMILGYATPIPDTGKVNTTGDNMYGTYNLWGSLTIKPGAYTDLYDSKYLRIPNSQPSSYYKNQIWSPEGLAGIMLRDYDGNNDTIPTMGLLRILGLGGIGAGADTGKLNTTGDDFIYGKICATGEWRFSDGGLRVPYSGENPLMDEEGELWFRKNDDRFYGCYAPNSYDYFVMARELNAWTGSTNITTLGNVATGTWSGSTIALNKGGTGSTTQAGALRNLLPSQIGKSGYVLTSNGTDAIWSLGAGSGGEIDDLSDVNPDIKSGISSYDVFIWEPAYERFDVLKKDSLMKKMLPSQTGNSNKVLSTNGANTLSWANLPDTLEEIIIGDNSFESGYNRSDKSIPYYDEATQKILFADSESPIAGDVPFFDGQIWYYENFVSKIKFSKSSYISWQGYDSSLTLLPDSQIIVFKTIEDIYLDSIVAGTGDSSVTLNFYCASQIDSLTATKGTKIFSSDQVITNNTTGTTFTTSISNRTIRKNSFVCLSIRSKTGKTNESVFTEIYYRKI